MALAITGALAAGCTPPAWLHRAPTLPALPCSTELPLYEPFSRMGPYVLGTVIGRCRPSRECPREDVLLYVDSGSSTSALLAPTFAHIGIETSSSRFVTIEDAAGQHRSWTGGLVPEVRVGDGLAIHDVVAMVGTSTPILGADVLAARGWQIDLDRATLRLGVEPWPATPDVTVVPTRTFRVHAIVDLRVAGEAVPVLVDTGAPFTVIDRNVLRRLGLRERPLRSKWPIAADRSAMMDTAFEGPVAIGDLDLGTRTVMADNDRKTEIALGVLGNDVLFAHVFQVTPAGLRLKPRSIDLAASAPVRVARWRDLPACPGTTACVAGEVVAGAPGGDGTPHPRVHFTAAPPRPFRYLFACADGDGHPSRSPLWIEIGIARPTAGGTFDVPFGADTPMMLRKMWARGCDRLVLIDANPVVDTVRGLHGAVEGRILMDLRNARF